MFGWQCASSFRVALSSSNVERFWLTRDLSVFRARRNPEPRSEVLMVTFAVEFWWKMPLTIFPANEARKSPSKLRRKFATNFAENFANFTLEIADPYVLTASKSLASHILVWDPRRSQDL